MESYLDSCVELFKDAAKAVYGSPVTLYKVKTPFVNEDEKEFQQSGKPPWELPESQILTCPWCRHTMPRDDDKRQKMHDANYTQQLGDHDITAVSYTHLTLPTKA